MSTYTRLFPNGKLQQLSGTLQLFLAPRDGVLLREEDGHIWVIYGRGKFHVPDMATYKRLFSNNPMYQLWNGGLSDIGRPTEPILLRDDSGAIWIIYGQAKFHVPDMATYKRLFGLGGIPIYQVWNGALDDIGTTPVDGTLLREEDNNTVFRIMQGRKEIWSGGGIPYRLWSGALAQFPGP